MLSSGMVSRVFKDDADEVEPVLRPGVAQPQAGKKPFALRFDPAPSCLTKPKVRQLVNYAYPPALQSFVAEADVGARFKARFLDRRLTKEFRGFLLHNDFVEITYQGGGNEDFIGLASLEDWTLRGKRSVRSWLAALDSIRDFKALASFSDDLRSSCLLIDMMLSNLLDQLSIGFEVMSAVDVICRRVYVLHLVLEEELSWSVGLSFLPLQAVKAQPWNPVLKAQMARRMKVIGRSKAAFGKGP